MIRSFMASVLEVFSSASQRRYKRERSDQQGQDEAELHAASLYAYQRETSSGLRHFVPKRPTSNVQRPTSNVQRPTPNAEEISYARHASHSEGICFIVSPPDTYAFGYSVASEGPNPQSPKPKQTLIIQTQKTKRRRSCF